MIFTYSMKRNVIILILLIKLHRIRQFSLWIVLSLDSGHCLIPCCLQSGVGATI